MTMLLLRVCRLTVEGVDKSNGRLWAAFATSDGTLREDVEASSVRLINANERAPSRLQRTRSAPEQYFATNATEDNRQRSGSATASVPSLHLLAC